MQYKNINRCLLDIMNDLAGKVDRKARKQWITQKVMDKMEEGRKWKNFHKEEGSKNCRKLRHELKSATDQAKK